QSAPQPSDASPQPMAAPAEAPGAGPGRTISGAPAYDGDKLRRPADYRQWIYLTTGFDMAYNPAMRMGHDMFDNVFAAPEAWAAFQKTGAWPDKTVLVLEARGAQSKGSINKAGHFQSTDLMGLEVHVRDDARFPGRWAFFSFEGDEPSTAQIP